MKTRPVRPGAGTARKLYEELDQLRQWRDSHDQTAEVIGTAYREYYKLDEGEALPSLPRCVAKLISDFNFEKKRAEQWARETRVDLTRTAWLAFFCLCVAFLEGIFIWVKIMGGIK